MRAACPIATFARQGLHCNGANPAAWRSWLIKPHWPVPPATRGVPAVAGFGRASARTTGAAMAWGGAEAGASKRASRRGVGSRSVILSGTEKRIRDADWTSATCGDGAECASTVTARSITPTRPLRDSSGLTNAESDFNPKFVRIGLVFIGCDYTHQTGSTSLGFVVAN